MRKTARRAISLLLTVLLTLFMTMAARATDTALIEGLEEGNYTVSVYNMGDLARMELLGIGPSDADPERAETAIASEDDASVDAQEEAAEPTGQNSKSMVTCVVVVLAFAILAMVLSPRKGRK
jgi:hypothetical protein